MKQKKIPKFSFINKINIVMCQKKLSTCFENTHSGGRDVDCLILFGDVNSQTSI